MCWPCKKVIIGRENRCFYLIPTRLGLLLIGSLNLFLFFCAFFNFIRVFSRAWDPMAWSGILIAFLRLLPYA